MTFCRSLFVLFACAAAASAEDSVDLTPWSNVGSGPLTVETSLRYAAQVTAEESSQALPVQGEVTLAYTQQEIASGPLGTRASSAASIVSPAPSCVPRRGFLWPKPEHRRRQGRRRARPLTRAELDVLQNAADPIDMNDALLPGGEVRDGGTWNVEPAMVGRLMRITPGDVCEVVGIVGRHHADPRPAFRLAGAIERTIDGAKVAIDLRGVALFDRDAGRLTKLNLAWKEKRELGPATPAMEATAKLNVAIEAATEESPLDADLIASVALKKAARSTTACWSVSPRAGGRC